MSEEEFIAGHCDTCNCAIGEFDEDADFIIFNDGYTAWVCGEWCRDKLFDYRRRNHG